MICDKCGQDFSYKVWKVHKNICSATKEELTENEIREKAKELGIKSWHVKNVDKLKSEIEKLEG